MEVQAEDLRYTEDGESARAILYQGFNDVNIFVEDRDQEYEYEVIFKKILGSDYRIAAIFSANGKPGVKERYNEYGSSTEGVKNFYIVDGDFDRYICPAEMIHDNCFIYLKPYNIENHLIDEEAVILFIQGKNKILYDTAKNLIDFSSWSSRIVQEAEKLFFLFCYVQHRCLGIENVGRSPYSMLDDYGFVKDHVCEAYRSEIISMEMIDEVLLQKIRNDYIAINGENYYQLICGKFLLASLTKYLRSKTHASFKTDDFRWFLVTNINPLSMEYVKQRIVS